MFHHVVKAALNGKFKQETSANFFSKTIISSRHLSFLSGSNATYIEELFESWKKDPNSVHKSWDLLFKASERGLNFEDYYIPPPSAAFSHLKTLKSVEKPHLNMNQGFPIEMDTISVYNLINAYQTKGHLAAKTDPFDGKFNEFSSEVKELQPENWNLNSDSLNKTYKLPSTTFIGGDKNELPLREIISSLKRVYTSSIGVEYSHMESQEEINWIKQQLEIPGAGSLALEDKCRLLSRVVRSTLFEAFLAKKYPSEKRFGLEGCDTMISSLKDAIDTGAEMGVESVVIGMAHRGRLNVLANVCRQPLEHIFSRFSDELQMEEDQGSSDVKYHLGLSRKHLNSKTGKEINLSVVANPSHLEAVNPVAMGKTKAEQFLRNDKDGSKVVCILIHGDAAFAGQGVVYESVNLSGLEKFNVHGTIHVVTNNQIGFTTNPHCSRTARYCTEVGKMADAPIFHVNADDPEAVAHVSNVASRFRNVFKKDVVIDLIGYRRNGHNEGDNPSFTQPEMYKVIANKPNVMELYSKRLIDSGAIDQKKFKDFVSSYEAILEAGFSASQELKVIENKIWIDSPWRGFFKDKMNLKPVSTGVSIHTIQELQKKCLQLPPSFVLHPAMKRIMSQRLENIEKGVLDWAMAEIAAFSTLLTSGVHVRLSGQDAERGTFSHRHHVLHNNQGENTSYCPLNHLSPDQALYMVVNSSLSEYGVLGFEHGYSMVSPNILVLWEGQFGDFANTAQCIIDQFVSSGEDKWIRQSGLVMLLPHGFDGMGPEHSSARLERFLQLTKEDPDVFPQYSPDTFEVEQIYKSNYIVAYPTTPANIFHLLRRQLSFDFRKPLVVMSPKNLLRLEMAKSPLEHFKEGTHFQRLIPDEGSAARNPQNVKRLIFCSGKLYYELVKKRSEKKLDDTVVIARIEQISPFPFDLVSAEISKYPNAELMYVQEEPKNQGAYYHVRPMIQLSCNYKKRLNYSGRPVSASPATGSKYQHDIEQKNLLENSFKF